METQARVMQVLGEVAQVPETTGADESLFDSGMLDSFTLNDLVVGLEKEFGIAIPDGDVSARKFDTVSKITQYVDGKSK